MPDPCFMRTMLRDCSSFMVSRTVLLPAPSRSTRTASLGRRSPCFKFSFKISWTILSEICSGRPGSRCAIVPPYGCKYIPERSLEIVGIAGVEKTPEEVDAVLAERRAAWKPRANRYESGALKLFTEHAVSAIKGGYME